MLAVIAIAAASVVHGLPIGAIHSQVQKEVTQTAVTAKKDDGDGGEQGFELTSQWGVRHLADMDAAFNEVAAGGWANPAPWMAFLSGSDVGVTLFGASLALSDAFQFFVSAGAVSMHHELINVSDVGDGEHGLLTASLQVNLAAGPPVLGLCIGTLRLSDQLMTHLNLAPFEADAELYVATRRARSKAKAFVQNLDTIFTTDRASFPGLFAPGATLSFNGQAIPSPAAFVASLPSFKRVQSYVEDASARADGSYEFQFMCKVFVKRSGEPDMITRSTWIVNAAGLATSFSCKQVTDPFVMEISDGLDAKVTAHFVRLDEIVNALAADNFRNPTAFFNLFTQNYTLSMFGYPTTLLDLTVAFRQMGVVSVQHTVDSAVRVLNDPNGVDVQAKTTVQIGLGEGNSMIAFCDQGLVRTNGNKLFIASGAFSAAAN